MAAPNKKHTQSASSKKLRAWLTLSRVPFLSVGVLPFILGNVLAWRHSGTIHWAIATWGTVGVVLIMLATYYAGEYWDYLEDTISGRMGGSRFAGGSQVLQRGLLPRNAALWASLASLVLALGVGLILWLVYKTGSWTMPFGIIGIAGGFFYSTRPLRWVTRGWGELWIAFCYGWLPVAVGYYLQIGAIQKLIHWTAIPIGFTIFNVILLNEFPDYQADLGAGKKNLIVRLGRTKAAILYSLIATGSWIAVILSIMSGIPAKILLFYLPVFILSLILVVHMMRGHWQNRSLLEKLCAGNLIVNLGTTASYIFAFVR
jgi:1,4-dihydroxy-2-naphthoate octaprenyltransferase